MTLNPYAAPATPLAASSPPTDRGLLWLLFSFEGRIPRRTFWGAALAAGVAFYAILFTLAFALPLVFDGMSSPGVFIGVAILLYLPLLWVSLALQVKRWHDRGKSGKWVFLSLVPLLGPFWTFIEICCARGIEGPNQYGPDPT